jgi:hypothetical protein
MPKTYSLFVYPEVSGWVEVSKKYPGRMEIFNIPQSISPSEVIQKINMIHFEPYYPKSVWWVSIFILPDDAILKVPDGD